MKEEVFEKKIKISRTRLGIPCLWESKANFKELNRATVILNNLGMPKYALVLQPNREKQALVPILVGDFISKAFKDNNGIALSIFKITKISTFDNTAVIIPVYRKSSIIADYIVPAEYENMVNMSVNKLNTPKSIVSQLRKKKLKNSKPRD